MDASLVRITPEVIAVLEMLGIHTIADFTKACDKAKKEMHPMMVLPSFNIPLPQIPKIELPNLKLTLPTYEELVAAATKRIAARKKKVWKSRKKIRSKYARKEVVDAARAQRKAKKLLLSPTKDYEKPAIKHLANSIREVEDERILKSLARKAKKLDRTKVKVLSGKKAFTQAGWAAHVKKVHAKRKGKKL